MSVFYKPTDAHCYLYFDSSDYPNTASIPYYGEVLVDGGTAATRNIFFYSVAQ